MKRMRVSSGRHLNTSRPRFENVSFILFLILKNIWVFSLIEAKEFDGKTSQGIPQHAGTLLGTAEWRDDDVVLGAGRRSRR